MATVIRLTMCDVPYRRSMFMRDTRLQNTNCRTGGERLKPLRRVARHRGVARGEVLAAWDSRLDLILSAAQLLGLRERDEKNNRGLRRIGGHEDAARSAAMRRSTPSTGEIGHLLL